MQYKKIAVLPAVIIAMSLTACGGSSKNKSSKGNEDDNIQSSGRLIVSNADKAEVNVLSLPSGDVVKTIAVTSDVSAVYSSPERRFGLIVQSDLIEMVDGGEYGVAHDDHYDLKQSTPAKLLVSLEGKSPSHYNVHGEHAAFFFDGEEGTGGLADTNAEVVVFTEEAIEEGADDEFHSLELGYPLHAGAEPRHEHLLLPTRQGSEGLPDQVELYEYHSDSGEYEVVAGFAAAACADLHGSFSTEEASVFGCSDGVLVITQEGETFTASKIATPSDMPEGFRISSFSGAVTAHEHEEEEAEGEHEEHHVIAAWAGKSGESQRHLFALHVDEGELEKVDWTHGDSATFSTAVMDDEGEVLAVLDTSGSVHLLDVENDFARIKKLKAIDTMPELTGHAKVSMVPSPKSDEILIIDSEANRILAVDVEHGEMKNPIKLGFEPSHAAWVGFSDEHVHMDGDHEEGDGHNH